MQSGDLLGNCSYSRAEKRTHVEDLPPVYHGRGTRNHGGFPDVFGEIEILGR